jgi:hypothetical protein
MLHVIFAVAAVETLSEVATCGKGGEEGWKFI